MLARSHTARRRVVLVGAGHAHLAVLRDFARAAVPGIELILVTPEPGTVYSGMVPGWLSGTYSLHDCTIAVTTLAKSAGARLVMDRVVACDAGARLVLLAGGGRLDYDLLSLDIGSGSNWSSVAPGRCEWMPLRPIAEFARRWEAWQASPRSASAEIVVVGGGAAGVEVALCIGAARRRRGEGGTVSLVTRTAASLGAAGSRAANASREAFAEAGVRLLQGAVEPSPAGPVLAGRRLLPADLAIVATGARAAGWLRTSGLATDADGFVRVSETQQSVSHSDVFATGDVSSRDEAGWSRSGVHAVRAGAVLAANLRSALLGRPLRAYRPRARSLALLATGSGRAIALWGSLASHSRWAWRWKRWIDERFVRQHREAA